MTTLGKVLPPFRLLIRKNISNCARKLSYIVESSHRSYRSRILHNNHCLLLHTALFSEQQCQEEREREREREREGYCVTTTFFQDITSIHTHTHTHTHRHTHTHTHQITYTNVCGRKAGVLFHLTPYYHLKTTRNIAGSEFLNFCPHKTLIKWLYLCG